MEKRGVSAIVATVLIVLISIIGIGIIWISFFSMIDDISDMGLRDVGLKIVSSEGYTVWDNESRLLSVQIERTGEGDVCGFDLIFVVGGNSVTHFVEEVLDVNENRVYYFNLSEYEGMLEAVRVAPVFCDGEVGDVTSELRFGDIGEGDLQGLIDEGVLDAEDFVEPSGSSGGGGGSGSSGEVEDDEDVDVFEDYVSWWKFDGNVSDESGLNDGVLYGDAVTVYNFGRDYDDGTNGYVLNLDGGGDYVDVPDDDSLDMGMNDFAVSLWINLNDVTTLGWRGVISKYGDESSWRGIYNLGTGWAIGIEGSGSNERPIGDWLLLAQFGDGINSSGSSFGYLKDIKAVENWAHVAMVVKRGGNMTLYANGVQVSVKDIGGITGDISNDLSVQLGYDFRQFNGLMDDVMIFNRSLSANEILEIYDAQRYSCTRLVKCSDYTDSDNCVDNPCGIGSVCAWDGSICSKAVSEIWYVRPEGGDYGPEDGTSYDNAWDGLSNVKWGWAGRVEAGDTLYVCGLHNKTGTIDPDISFGTSDSSRVTIRGDCPDGLGTDQGISDGYVWGINEKEYTTFSNLEFYNFGRFIELNSYTSHITWENCTLSNGPTLYLPTGSHYMKVIDCELSWMPNGIYTVSNGNDAPSNYVFSGNYIHDIGVRVDQQNGDSHGIGIQGGYNGLIENNYIVNAGNSLLLYTAYNQELINTTVRYNYVKDAHSIGDTDGYGIVFQTDQRCISERTGNEIYGNVVENASVGYRTSFTRDLVKLYNNIAINSRGTSFKFFASSYVIDFDSGTILFSRNDVITQDSGASATVKDISQQIGSSPNIEGTVSLDDRVGSFVDGEELKVNGVTYAIADGADYKLAPNIEMKNSISFNPGSLHVYWNTGGSSMASLVSEYNLFWSDSGAEFDDLYGGDPVDFAGWQAKGWDALGSLAVDPLFVNSDDPLGLDGIMFTADDGLRLQSESLARNAGVDVGLPYNEGAPDIGAYEY